MMLKHLQNKALPEAKGYEAIKRLPLYVPPSFIFNSDMHASFNKALQFIALKPISFIQTHGHNSTILFICGLMSCGIFLGIGVWCGLYYARRKAVQHLQEAGLCITLLRPLKDAKSFNAFLQLFYAHLKLREISKQNHKILVQGLQERYHYMASQALAIVSVSSKFTQTDDAFKVLDDLCQITSETSLPLQRMVQGYPMPTKHGQVNIGQSFAFVQSIFMPKIIESGIKLNISGDLDHFLHTDKIILEIVLYNLFQMAIRRIHKNGVIQIQVQQGHQLEITFKDNGYDFEDRLYKASVASQPNALLMDQRRLHEFMAHLEWSIDFISGYGESNIIKLSVPLAANQYQDNILYSSGYKKYL